MTSLSKKTPQFKGFSFFFSEIWARNIEIKIYFLLPISHVMKKQRALGSRLFDSKGEHFEHYNMSYFNKCSRKLVFTVDAAATIFAR